MSFRHAAHPADDRRLHPRRAVRSSVEVLTNGAVVPCELVDLSEGGARLCGEVIVPRGRVQLVLGDRLGLDGQVVEEVIDVESGLVTTRVVFDAQQEPDVSPVAATQRRTRRALALAGIAVAATLFVVGMSRGNDDEPVAGSDVGVRRPAPEAEADASTADGVSPAAGSTAPDAASPSPAEGQTTNDPTEAASGAPPSAPAPPVAPTPAMVTTTEAADNALTVTIAEDPAENSAESSVGPSSGIDRVRVELHVNLEQTPSGYTAGIAIENRGDDALTFDGGLRAVIGARRDGTVVETISLHRADITELAPGASVTVEGVLALAEPGTYDVFGSVEEVTTSASDENSADG